MRWSIIRLIWMRDLRDQLRDRRTLFMMIGLPILLYPVVGAAVLGLALSFGDRSSKLGVVRPAGLPDDFPQRVPPSGGLSVAPAVAWLSATPLAGPIPAAPTALAQASRLHLEYPALIEAGRFTAFDASVPPRSAKAFAAEARFDILFFDEADANAALADRKVDLLLSAPPDFYTRLEEGEDPHEAVRTAITIRGRAGDEHSRLARQRLERLIETWKRDVKRVRLARRGIPERY